MGIAAASGAPIAIIRDRLVFSVLASFCNRLTLRAELSSIASPIETASDPIAVSVGGVELSGSGHPSERIADSDGHADHRVECLAEPSSCQVPPVITIPPMPSDSAWVW